MKIALNEIMKSKPKQWLLQWLITANENNTMNQWELKANTRDWRQARENTCDQVVIGFGFTSDWLRRWRKFFEPIIECSKKPNQFSDYFRQSLLLVMNDNIFKCWLKFGDIFAKFNTLRVHLFREIAKINPRKIWLCYFRENKYARKLVRINVLRILNRPFSKMAAANSY